MRNVEFLKVGFKNFSCYVGDGLELSFENGKLILITGPNGIGKTTIFDALSYSMYGRTTKGGTGEDVINNTAGKNCLAWTEFKIDDDLYKVSRYVKYTKIGTTVILEKNGESIKKGHKEVVPYIESIFMPHKLFMNTLMFSQRVKDFFTDLNDSAQKEIFRKILLLDEWLDYQKQATELLKKAIDIQSSIEVDVQVKSESIKTNKDTIAQLIEAEKQFDIQKKQGIELFKTKRTTLVDQSTKISSEIATLELEKPHEKYELVNGHITTINTQLKSIDDELKGVNELIEAKKENKISELTNQASEKRNDLHVEFTKAESQLKTESSEKLAELNKCLTDANLEKTNGLHEISNLESEIRRHEDTATMLKKASEMKGRCPTCLQILGDEEKITLSEEHHEQLHSAAKLKDKVANLKEVVSFNYKQVDDSVTRQSTEINIEYTEKIAKEREKYTFETNELTVKLQELLKKVDEVAESQIASKSEEFTERKSELIKKGQELDKSRREVIEVLDKINNLKDTLSDVKTKISEIDLQIETKEKSEFDKTQMEELIKKNSEYETELEKSQLKLKQVANEIKIIEFWKKEGFSSSGIPSMLIDDSIPFMNKTVAEYCDKIAGGRYVVSFDTLKPDKNQKTFKDKIHIEIFDTITKSNKRVKFSGGQTRIVDIATILTLRDLQSNFQDMKINILLFDEIFDSLDDENIGYVSKLLKKLTDKLCVVIVSHRHFDAIEADEHYKLGG